MPEPVIGPLAAFGLSITILNFFLSTIRSMHERWGEINDYNGMIDDSKRGLFISVGTYGLWLKTWGHRNEQRYHKLFGASGWAEIERCKRRIEDLARQTADLVSLKVKPPANPEPATDGAGNRASSRTRLFFRWAFELRRQRRRSHAATEGREQLGNSVVDPVTAEDEHAWEAFVEESTTSCPANQTV